MAKSFSPIARWPRLWNEAKGRRRGSDQSVAGESLLALMRLMSGCEGITRTFPLNGMRMILLSTARARSKFVDEEALEKRLSQCRLELHPDKTKVVYCKDEKRRGHYLHEKFDFLGLRFGLGWQSSVKEIWGQLHSGGVCRSSQDHATYHQELAPSSKE